MNFRKRSYAKELLDGEDIPREALYRNLHELEVINRLLGGHAVTLKGMENLHLKKDRMYQILDIGSGGGDTLLAIAKWGRKHGYQLELTGVDLNPDCIAYAKDFCRHYHEIHFIQGDYRDLSALNHEFDIVITSLFCHHLNETELEGLFSWWASNAKVAMVVNDLHRHPLAYYGIALLTALFSRSYLVKHDARLSVLRGFRRKELHTIVPDSPFFTIRVLWCWAFRWLIIIRPAKR